MRKTVGKILAGVSALALLVAILPSIPAGAAQITSRKLTLVAGASDGGSKAGGVVNHLFNFSLPSNTSVGSIKFEYCTTASVATCVTPTGLVTTSATLSSQTGATGFTLNNTTNGAPYITRTAATATGAVSYQLNTITNPTANNTSFFVRITSYSSTNATTGATDNGSVTASTADPIVLTGTMPESLIFCTGATVNTNCTTTTPGSVTFNQLFSPSDTATATSQMSASTNATNGYVITVNGATLTSGANTIPALSTAATAASTRGSSRWGMNLKANTTASSTVAVGTEITPTSNGTDLRGQATTGYDTADTFKYVSGDVVANSANGGAGPTNSQVYTASYIVNVAGNQLAGTYTTTLTYICTPTF